MTTRNCNRFINSHNLQFTRTHPLVFSACYVFTSLLVTASNSGRTLSSLFSNCPDLSYSNSRLTDRLIGLTPH
jgi:hypothetical protein